MATVEENAAYETMYSGMVTLDLAREMKGLQERKTELEAQLTEINKRYDFLRLNVIPNRFENEGILNMNIEGVGRVQLASDVYASIKADKKQEAFQYLSDTGHGDVVQPGINPSTLKALMKSMIKKGEEIPSELFNVTPFTRASIVKA